MLESVFVVPALELALREADAGAEPIVVEWGRVAVRPVRLGRTIGLRASEPAADLRFFYRWREGDGELSSGWTLEPGEAPVLLLACLDARDASTVERAMVTAAAVAGVLLVEVQDGETDE